MTVNLTLDTFIFDNVHRNPVCRNWTLVHKRSVDIEVADHQSCSFKTTPKPDTNLDNIAELIIESGTFKNEVDLQIGFKMGQFSCLTVYTVDEETKDMIQQVSIRYFFSKT